MELAKKILRLAFFALLLALLLGLDNVQNQPMLAAFLLALCAMRALELRHAAREGLIHWYRAEQHPRWIVWLGGASFLANVVLPILDHRYRGEVFWSSPFPRAEWWLAAIGIALFIAGSWRRLQTIVVKETPKPVTKILDTKHKGKGKVKVKVKEEEPEPLPAPSYFLPPAFYHATALSYFGIAVCCTSLWGALAIAAVILPPLFYGKGEQASATAS